MTDKQYFLLTATSKEGINCKDGSFQRLMNEYNAKSGYNYDGEGCSEFAVTCMLLSCNKDIPKENWSMGQVNDWKSRNKFHYTDPQAGDYIYFDNVGKGETDHTAIIYKVDGNTLYTVEGNMKPNKSVRLLTHKIGDWNIYGYGRPDYTNKIYKSDITTYQQALIKDGFKLVADGKYEYYTKKVTSRLMLGRETPYTNTTEWLQVELKSVGYFKGIVDGVYGDYTKRAVKLMQKHYGLYQDGIAGKNTLEFLLGVTYNA